MNIKPEIADDVELLIEYVREHDGSMTDKVNLAAQRLEAYLATYQEDIV